MENPAKCLEQKEQVSLWIFPVFHYRTQYLTSFPIYGVIYYFVSHLLRVFGFELSVFLDVITEHINLGNRQPLVRGNERE